MPNAEYPHEAITIEPSERELSIRASLEDHKKEIESKEEARSEQILAKKDTSYISEAQSNAKRDSCEDDSSV